jgi:hypothetical protein
MYDIEVMAGVIGYSLAEKGNGLRGGRRALVTTRRKDEGDQFGYVGRFK